MDILIVNGHPDPDPGRFCHALTAAYQRGAEAGGHTVRVLEIATMKIPCLRSAAESYSGECPNMELKQAQEAITWSEHIVIVYPLWLGDVPAYFKAFLEHVFSPGFAFDEKKRGKLHGRSARIIVTMGMPAFFYRWYFWSHSLISLKRNILHFVGIKPVKETLIGSVDTTDHEKWLKQVEQLGCSGD